MDITKINHCHNPASGISGARKIYMIGIKGVGMTMLAQYLAGQGIEVIGSDTEEKFMTDKVLKKDGIKVIEKFDANNIPKGADLIIYSSAYNADNNIEVAKAVAGRIKTMTYAQAMGKVFNQKYGIAVVGSHGKTTTTAWLGYVMQKAGLEPSVMVGAQADQLNGCGITGKSDYLVIEADEYQNKLKYFQPKAALLNNIDYDHPDFFPTKDEYKNVFIEFIKKIPVKGFLVANFDDPVIRKIVNESCKCKVVGYAIAQNENENEGEQTFVRLHSRFHFDYVAYEIKQQGNKQCFNVKLGVDESEVYFESDPALRERRGRLQNKSRLLGNFCIQLSGKHNISNALAVIAACVELGIDLSKIRKYLEEFTGTARRMQIMGKFNNAIIIDDYAHHPTEIKTTLAGVRQIYKNSRCLGGTGKLIVIFHPHTFTRTKVLLDDFAKSFSDADEVIVLDIYGSARERHGGVHSKDLVDLIKKQKNPPLLKLRRASAKTKKQKIDYIPTLDECERYLRENVGKGDVVILMGAGDVFKIGENLVE